MSWGNFVDESGDTRDSELSLDEYDKAYIDLSDALKKKYQDIAYQYGTVDGKSWLRYHPEVIEWYSSIIGGPGPTIPKKF